MTTVNVLFLANCGDDAKGEHKAIPLKRAQKLERTGYVQIVDGDQETRVKEAPESAMRARPEPRGPKPERRG